MDLNLIKEPRFDTLKFNNYHKVVACWWCREHIKGRTNKFAFHIGSGTPNSHFHIKCLPECLKHYIEAAENLLEEHDNPEIGNIKNEI